MGGRMKALRNLPDACETNASGIGEVTIVSVGEYFYKET